MLVAAWFIFIFLVILFGFGLVFATFLHWYKESKVRKKNKQVGERSGRTAVDLSF